MKQSPTQAPSWYATLKTWADHSPTIDPPLWLRSVRLAVRLVLLTIGEFDRNALSLRSAALTYTVLLSLVPILALSTAVVKGFGGDDQLRQTAYNYIDTLTRKGGLEHDLNKADIPSQDSSTPEQQPANLTDHLFSAVDQLFDYVDKTNFATLGSLGVIGILLSAILVLSNIEEAMNGIWKVASGRSLLRRIADYLTLLVLFPISINVAFAAGALLQNPALIAKLDIFTPFAWLQTLLLKGLPVAIITLTFYVMYIFFPNTKVKTLPALFGATFAALLWTMVQSIYISLQIGVANYNAIYGSFATLPLFLVWIYLGWLFILTGAQVAYACQNLHSLRLVPLAATPSMILGAAFDIIDCLSSALAGAKVITTENLPAHLPAYQPALVSLALAALRQAGLIHVSRTDNRLLPAALQQDENYRNAVAAILGRDAATTGGGSRSLAAIKAASEALLAPAADTTGSAARHP